MYKRQEQMGKRQISLAQTNEIAEHAILAISQRNGTQPVSYTHLDVYKRQV